MASWMDKYRTGRKAAGSQSEQPQQQSEDWTQRYRTGQQPAEPKFDPQVVERPGPRFDPQTVQRPEQQEPQGSMMGPAGQAQMRQTPGGGERYAENPGIDPQQVEQTPPSLTQGEAAGPPSPGPSRSELIQDAVENRPSLTGPAGLEQMGPNLDPRVQFDEMESTVRQAEAMGIEPGGAPFDLRKYYLQTPPDRRKDLSQTLVNRYFEKRTKGKAGEVPVDYSEELATHIFKDPTDGKWRPLNTIGPDLAESWQLSKYVLGSGVPSAAVGVATAPLVGPTGAGALATTTDAAISGAIRASEISGMQEEGLLPEDISATSEGMEEAGYSLAGSVLGTAAGGIGRRMISGPGGIPGDVQVDRKVVSDMLDRWERRYGESARDTNMQPTLGDKMKSVAETAPEQAAARRVKSFEERMANMRETQKAMTERAESNKAAIRDSLQGFMRTAGAPEQPEAFRVSGITQDEILSSVNRLTNNLEMPAREQIARYDEALTNAYTEANRQTREFLDEGIDPSRMPDNIVSAVDMAEENFRQNMAREYDALAEAAGGQKTFDIQPVRDLMDDVRKEMQQNAKVRSFFAGEGARGLEPSPKVRPGATAEEADDPMEYIFGDAFRREDSGLMVPDSVRREAAEDPMFTYKDVNNALQNLRQRIREVPEAKQSDAVMRQVHQIEDALKEVRVQGLRNVDENLANQQQALDYSYSLGSETLRRGIGREIATRYLQPRRTSDGELVSDGIVKPETFRKLFSGDTGASTVRDLKTLEKDDIFAAGPNRPLDSLGVRDNVRRALLGEFNNRFTTRQQGPGRREAQIVSPEQLENFKREYGHAMDYAFTPEQRQQMETLGGMRQVLEKAQADVEDVTKEVRQFPWGNEFIADNPTEFWRRTWGAVKGDNRDLTKVQASKQYRDILREQGDPQGLLSDYQKLIAHEMATEVTDPDTRMIDPQRMKTYIDEHEELLKEWYTVPSQNKSGTDYVNKMRSVADMAENMLGTENLGQKDYNAVMKTLDTVARAYTGIFTMPGRILTATKQVAGGMGAQRKADFALNPEKYVRNQEFFDVMDSQWMRQINRSGGQEIMRYFRQDDVDNEVGWRELEEQQGEETLEQEFGRFMDQQRPQQDNGDDEDEAPGPQGIRLF